MERDGQDRSIAIKYTNYKGETKLRHVCPLELTFARTVYHPEKQWLLSVYDLDKNAYRDFALKDCDFTSQQ